jgi:hypothetical protein
MRELSHKPITEQKASSELQISSMSVDKHQQPQSGQPPLNIDFPIPIQAWQMLTLR